MIDNNQIHQNMLEILEHCRTPYYKKAEDIKKIFPLDMQVEKLKELHQMMIDDPTIKAITKLIADKAMHEGAAFVVVGGDGDINIHSNLDVLE